MGWKDYENKSTAELISEINNKSKLEHQEQSEDAFRAFTFRYSADVVRKARIVAMKWGYDKSVGDEIAEQTFARFWKYPHSFAIEKCTCGDIEKCIRLYLYRIAQNQLVGYANSLHGDTNPYTGEETLVVDYPELSNLGLSEESLQDITETYNKIKQALDKLSHKHKIIYLTYHAYEQKGYKMPRKLLQTLRDELQISQNSIRVYKKEANEQVAKIINDGN